MSKKKAAKKAAPKKKPVAKVLKHTPKKNAPKPRTQSPRSQTLPGMEQIRNRALDRICEAISDTRADLNRARAEEKDLQGQAVREMEAKKVTVYRFAGVELVLVPGDVHLRVRTLKSQANADAPSEADAEPDDTGVTADEINQTPDDQRLAEQDKE